MMWSKIRCCAVGVALALGACGDEHPFPEPKECEDVDTEGLTCDNVEERAEAPGTTAAEYRCYDAYAKACNEYCEPPRLPNKACM